MANCNQPVRNDSTNPCHQRRSNSAIRKRFCRESSLIGLSLLVAYCFGFPLAAQTELPPMAAEPQQLDEETKPAETVDPAELLEGLRLTPKALRMATEKVRPSLVTIESFGGATAVEGRIGGIRRQGEGNSTGLLISSEGHIVTSTFNFIRKPPVIMVVTSDGTRHVAKMLGSDQTRKICVLKIEGPVDLPLPEFTPVDELAIGQWAVSLGVGYGDKNPAASTGIVSALNRAGGRAVQTDANISPANYGGPLLDIQGRVIGVCVPLNPRSQAAGAGVEWYDSGIGFAIPLAGSDRLLEKLKAGEDIRPGFLGVQMKTEPIEGGGVAIESVQDDSPAAKGGIEAEDVIIAVNDQPIDGMPKLRTLIQRMVEGEVVTMRVRRGEEELDLEVTLGSTPDAESQE